MLFRSVYVPHAHTCSTTKKLFLFLFLQNFKRWWGRIIWSNFFTTFFCLGEILSPRSTVQSPVQRFLIGYARNITWQVDKTTPCTSNKTTWRVEKMTWLIALRNRDLYKHLLVNANLSVNQMSPIIKQILLVAIGETSLLFWRQ